mgnify:CR=1 FL=1
MNVQTSKSEAPAVTRVTAGVTFAAKLAFENISHAFGPDAETLNDVTLTAEPGEVLVGPATHAATQRTIAYERRGALDAKGREEPVERQRRLRAVGEPEPLQPRKRQQRRVKLALGHLPQPRLDIAAQQRHLEIRPRAPELRLPPQ